MFNVIQKISVLLKITGIILMIIFSNAFSRNIIDFYLKTKIFFFSQNIMRKSSRLEKDKK